MMNVAFRSSSLIAAWVAALGIIVAASLTMGANHSTTALLLALGVAPALVIALLAHGQPSPSVAQILYSVETNEGRL
jgi:hypothetical protein